MFFNVLIKVITCPFRLKMKHKRIEAYNKIWGKVRNLMKKEFDNGPVHNKKCLKTKIKFVMVVLTQIFTIMECLKKVLIVFVCQ